VSGWFPSAPSRVAAGLIVGSTLALVGWVAFRGVSPAVDSVRYTEGSAALLAGEPISGMATGFLGYVALLALFELMGAGILGVVGLQILVAAAAAACLYHLARELGGPWAGVLATALFVGYIDLARWHTFLLPDSLYISGVVIMAWAVHRAAESGGWWYGAATVLVVLLALLRPNGVVLVPVVALYWALRRTTRPLVLIGAVCVVGLAAFAAFAPIIQTVAEQQALVRRLGSGAVIGGAISGGAMSVEMPGSLREGGIDAVARYVADHPVATLRLVLLRVGWAMANVRPYYSTPHNAYIIAVLLPTYLLAAWGAAQLWRRPLARLLAAIFAANMTVIAVTIASYDGRYLLYGLPMVMALAGAGGVDLASRLLRRTSDGAGTEQRAYC
jgi:hypothetical protein